MQTRIVLASSSVYRRELLTRLRLPFDIEVPAVDESALTGEVPADTALRLALLKAQTVAARLPEAIVIGSDQVAELDGAALGKPGSHPAALAQLQSMQGRTVTFHTALALVDAGRGRMLVDTVPTRVAFRTLPREALDAYLRVDQPYDCTGAAKIESLGICLVDAVHSDDPTALVGLPLIRLTSMLAAFGIGLPLR
jgi:septum formation protein